MRGEEVRFRKKPSAPAVYWAGLILVLILAACPISSASALIPLPGSQEGVDNGDPDIHDGLSQTGALQPSLSIRLKAAKFDPMVENPGISSKMTYDIESGYYIIQCAGPIQPHWGRDIRAEGVQILGYIPDYAYLVFMDGDAKEGLEELPFIRWVGGYHPGYKFESKLAEKEGELELNVLVFGNREGNVALVRNQLAGMGAVIVRDGKLNNIIRVRIDSSKIDDIAFIPEVEWMEEYAAPRAYMNNVRAFTGANMVRINGFNGSGIVGEVKDDGIDLDHPDFAGQIIGTDGNPPDGDHGTATFGIVFSSGENEGTAMGMMPGGKGVFCEWDEDRVDSVAKLKNYWGGVFQSNSWSSGALDSEYKLITRKNDEAVFDYDITMLYAAGNSDYGVYSESLTEDSVAKNVICVGALRHYDNTDRTDDRWVNTGPDATPSQGPASDGRIKPDISGPFDDTFTTDSVDGDGENGYNNHGVDTRYGTDIPEDPTGNYYPDFGGTSCATPVVAGAVGLLYQMYKENHFGNNPEGDIPHASTVKAILIADAYQYDFSQANRYQQGWGGVDIANVYSIGQEHVIIDEPQPLKTGESTVYSVIPTGDGPLKITLVWTDVPSTTSSAQHLINNLDLKVTDPDGYEYWGNRGLTSSKWSITGGSADTKNNVENVFIENPTSGNWTVEIIGQHIPFDGYEATTDDDQIYSLVASNAVQKVAINISNPSPGEFVSDFTTISGTAFDEAIHIEVKIGSGQWNVATGTLVWSYTWDTQSLPDGEYTIYARAFNGVSYSHMEHVTVFVDNSPPATAITVGLPNYYDDPIYYVVNSTQFTVNADDGAGSGVDYIWHTILYETQVVEATSGGTFDLHWGEGNYTVQYYSADINGNVNGTFTLYAYVDSSPPKTDMFIGHPKHRGVDSDFWNVTIDTLFDLSDVADASTFDFTWYFIDEDFYVGTNFTLKNYFAGPHTITWGSADVFGHNETGNAETVVLDRTPPSTDFEFGQPKYRLSEWYVSNTTVFSFDSYDDYAGLNYTWHTVDGEFSTGASLTLEGYEDGPHLLEWGAVDHLGINKTENSHTFYLDSHPPTSDLSIQEPKFRAEEGHFWNVTPATFFRLSAFDELAGVRESGIWYTIDGVYYEEEQFRLDNLLDGEHHITWGSIDNLAQNESAHTITVKLDSSPPETALILGEPKYRAHEDHEWNVSKTTSFSLAANDSHAGVASTWCTIDGRNFQGTFFNLSDWEEGYHTITWGSVDNLGNEEDTRSASFYMNTVLPSTTLHLGQPKYKKEGSDHWNITEETPFTLEATTPHTANDFVWYTIDSQYHEGTAFTLSG
ncbi:MAG: S8 family serine peptidase, partial [Thermoplasmata archaeon]